MKILKSLFHHRDLVLLGAVIVLVAVLLHRSNKTAFTPGAPTPAASLPGTTVVTVHDLQPAQVVSDPHDKATIAQLVAELKAAKAVPIAIAATTATDETHGTLEPVISNNTVEVPKPFQFKDWHLTVQSDGKDVTYDLKQSFVVETAIGRDKQGKPLAGVRLYEVGPGDTRKRLDATTTEAVIDETVPHFLVGLSVQAGIGVSSVRGTLLDLQWLKRGRADNPRDLKWAFVSPAFFFGDGVHEFGVLPVSMNVASFVRHQPFTNVWFSPYVGFEVVPTPHVSRVGAGITFTF